MQHKRCSSEEEFVTFSAHKIKETIDRCLKAHGLCSIVLAGGNTPRPIYERLGVLLSAKHVDSSRLFFFLGDERHVPAFDTERNDKMIEDSFFRFYQPTRANVFFWDTPPLPPEECAARYEQRLKSYFMYQKSTPDITLLGLGADGHTASLFPGAEAAVEGGRRTLRGEESYNALAVWVPSKSVWRLTLSAFFLRSSKEMLIFAGRGKEEAVKKLTAGDRTIPAAWVVQDRTIIVEWVL
jgi:6-phosphogluconolactonase